MSGLNYRQQKLNQISSSKHRGPQSWKKLECRNECWNAEKGKQTQDTEASNIPNGSGGWRNKLRDQEKNVYQYGDRHFIYTKEIAI